MKRVVKGISGLVLLALIGGAIFLFLLWSRVPDIVASKLSERLQTRFEIGDIKLGLKTLSVDRFDIHNPRGYTLPKAFSANQIMVEAPLAHYIKDHIEIEQIVVSDVYIGLEFDSPKSTNGNWKTLLGNTQKAQDESTKSASQKTVLIKRLLLTNIQAELYYHSDGKVRKLKPIRQIELRDISSQGGNIGDQLLNSALGKAVKQIFIEENLKDILDQLFQAPSKPADYLGPLKNFFNYAPKEIEEPLAKTL